MQEIWKEVTFDRDYEVSNLGNFRRKDLYVRGKNNAIRHLPSKKCDVLFYGNYGCVSIRGKNYSIVMIVAMAFMTNGIKPKYCYHINGDITDNRACNIAIGKKQSVITEGDDGMSEIEYIRKNYDVSEDGIVTRKRDKRVLKGTKNKRGYLVIRLKLPLLSKNKDRRKPYKIHRLVAMFYLDNYSDKLQVNHKNGIKTDNRVENLEMVTNRENFLHYINVLKPKRQQNG